MGVAAFFFGSIERIRYAAALAIALAGLLALVVLALLVGRYPLSLSDLPMLKTVVLEIRGPRVLAAALVGASLAAAGTVYQGILRNPLAVTGLVVLAIARSRQEAPNESGAHPVG